MTAVRRIDARLLPGLAFTLLLAACSGSDDNGEFYTEWDLAGGCVSDRAGADRHDARGRMVDVCANTVGRWTWVSYAAGWCSTSRGQAPAVRRLAHSPRPDLDVFVVLTSGEEVFSLAGRGDAQAWASRYGLSASQVLYEAEGGNRTLPQHLLIGPDGRTWYRYIGVMESVDMERLIADFEQGVRTPDVRELPAP